VHKARLREELEDLWNVQRVAGRLLHEDLVGCQSADHRLQKLARVPLQDTFETSIVEVAGQADAAATARGRVELAPPGA
jgi:histone H3/H4